MNCVIPISSSVCRFIRRGDVFTGYDESRFWIVCQQAERFGLGEIVTEAKFLR